MRIEKLEANFNRLYIHRFSIWFSYGEPVAVKSPQATLRTSTKHSTTTTRHTNKHVDTMRNFIDQEDIDYIVILIENGKFKEAKELIFETHWNLNKCHGGK